MASKIPPPAGCTTTKSLGASWTPNSDHLNLGETALDSASAERQPLAGRVVPELQRDDIRELLLRTYRIVYRLRPAEIHVLTVFEGHRLLRKQDIVDADDEWT
jgi:hypothetical protein